MPAPSFFRTANNALPDPSRPPTEVAAQWFSETLVPNAVLLRGIIKGAVFSQVLIDEFTQWNSLHEYGVAGT
jgi:hypothetical protein